MGGAGPSIRDEIIKRDKGECYLCGKVIAPELIVLDHIIPRSRGGTNAINNLAVACKGCDERKADYLLSELEWVSSKVKAKFSTLKRERARNSQRLIVVFKRVQLAVMALTHTTADRLDNLIEIAKRK